MEPIRLKVKNFYSILDGEIDFTKFSSALILGQYENNVLMSNGAGKSSCYEAIAWCLFGETRQSKIDDVIRWTANEALVEFEFLFGNHMYKISRKRSRIAKESSISLYIKENNKWINESGSISSETNRKILSLLKIDAKIFLNSVYFKQHDISLFANSSPSDRKDIIKSIMKLERWDEYQKMAKNKLRIAKEHLEEQVRIIEENVDLDVKLLTIDEEIKFTKIEMDAYTIKQKEGQEKLHSLIALKNEYDTDMLTETLRAINSTIADHKNNGKHLQGRQAQIEEVLFVERTKVTRLNKDIELSEQHIKQNDNEIDTLQQNNYDYVELESKLLQKRVEKSKVEGILHDLSNYEDKIGVGECQLCFTQITADSLPHIHKNRQDKEQAAKATLKTLTKQLDALEKEYSTRKHNAEMYNERAELSAALKYDQLRVITQKTLLDQTILALTNENAELITSMKSLIEQIKTAKIEADSIERKIKEQKINNIHDEIARSNEKNSALLSAINAKNLLLGTLLKEKQYLEDKQELLATAKQKTSALAKDKTSYEQLVRFFGKEGIQAVFIESVVDELEQYANATLAHICNEPTVIKLKTQKKMGDSWQETLEIDVVMNGYPQTFESLGGGERFRISLALRIGLSEVLVKRAGGEIKLLLLDEVDSPLDSYGLNNLFENIIKGLEKRFKILVISHNDHLKNRFDDVIVVNKTSKGSLITQN